MRNSIQHFIDFRITNLQESAKKFSQSPQDIAGFVNAVKEEALQFALDFMGETFTTCNDVLRESPVRKASISAPGVLFWDSSCCAPWTAPRISTTVCVCAALTGTSPTPHRPVFPSATCWCFCSAPLFCCCFVSSLSLRCWAVCL